MQQDQMPETVVAPQTASGAGQVPLQSHCKVKQALYHELRVQCKDEGATLHPLP